MVHGTLMRGMGGFYTVVDEAGQQFTLRCKKKFRRMHLSPLVGDEVLFTPGEGEEHGWLEEILPRKTECIRPPVANVSLLLIVASPTPAPDMLLIDRLMVRARMQNMRMLLVATKGDLDPTLADTLRTQYAGADVPVYPVCAATGEGLDALREAMRGELCCLAGQSGVGKSTLLNALLGLELETGEISRKIQRGKNTTRHAEMLLKDGLRVLDTAGFSLLELDGGMDPVTLKDYYPEFAEHEGECRFTPCFHDREPGCAVTAACEAGEIDPERLARYRTLLTEVRTAWRERYD
ncbi:MAG: ribosome small subunit-dependent GTPase A [Clostridia bacterium]|nr:ribosome small subunit-dependent GTPase A [Clostridia bacterium]